jgi:hypothetical protein
VLASVRASWQVCLQNAAVWVFVQQTLLVIAVSVSEEYSLSSYLRKGCHEGWVKDEKKMGTGSIDWRTVVVNFC